MITRVSSGNAPKPFMAELDKDTERAIHAMTALTDPFVNVRATMPLQYVRTFLLITAEEGRTINDYAQKAGVPQSVMSRHILDIGERNRHKEPGFGLVVSKMDPMDMRNKQVWLTAKGKGLMAQLVRAIKNI